MNKSPFCAFDGYNVVKWKMGLKTASGTNRFIELMGKHPEVAGEIGTSLGRHGVEALDMVDLFGPDAARAYAEGRTLTRARMNLAGKLTEADLQHVARKQLPTGPYMEEAMRKLRWHVGRKRLRKPV